MIRKLGSLASSTSPPQTSATEDHELRLALAWYDAKCKFGDKVSIAKEELCSHSHSLHSHHHGRCPVAIMSAHTTQDVSDFLKICNYYRVPVVPYGSGTALEGQTTHVEDSFCLNLSPMHNVVEIRPDDLDCTVETGISWNHLNDILRPHNLYFPVDPGPGASIGGMIATSCSGTLCVRYGPMPHHVLSTTAVLADGTILKTGQRARKSSAGYHLTQLLVGSEGTLAVVTEATLKLSPIPASTGVVVVNFDSIRDAALATVDLLRAGVALGCVEVADENMVRGMNSYSGLSLPERPTLLVKLMGKTEEVKSDLSRVDDVVSQHGGHSEWATLDKAETERLWQARKGALWACMAMRPGASAFTTDVAVPISRLADCIEATRQDLSRTSILAPIVGHVGDGNFHVCMIVDRNNPVEAREAERIHERMVDLAISMGGTCTGEHGVGTGKKSFLVKELGHEAVGLMRTIKRALDPNGILNPGKIFDISPQEPKKNNT